MRSMLNYKFLKRQLRIAQYTSLLGLLFFGVGIYLTFAKPEAVTFAFVLLILGFLISQVGIYFGNRYGRQPRIDRVLDEALKTIGGDHTLFHYATPASHLIIGPSGLWVLVPKYQRGRIRYHKGRWRQSGGLVLWYLRIFSQEGLGRPDLEIEDEVKAVRKALEEHLGPEEAAQVPIEAILVFTNPKAELVNVDGAPVPTLKPEDLKAFLQPRLKEKRLSPALVRRIKDALVRWDEIEESKALKASEEAARKARPRSRTKKKRKKRGT
ncbi:MAG: NERD domain-containing protein [Chloroflexi bacterium]|nr:NERD domain-containing protein [Chloroflexota bacterium]